MLREHRERQRLERIMLGDDYHDEDLVFCEPDGRPLNPRGVSQLYGTTAVDLTAEETEAATREAERRVPHVRLHDLRHGAATAGLAAGVPRELVGRQLGHSRASTMTELYQSHPVDEAEQAAADKIAARLDGPG